ncbi:MAG: hypothetical protein GF384_06665 [Elusimicrobia bacterium]|nr:hypothetical protein [Elusimicrobiota bacterium]MBD3412386.1 hypothetical protein [Elusimicrobiota bacterium]
MKPDDLHVHVDPELIGLIPEFLAHRKTDIHRIRELVDRESFDLVAEIGHTMKGSGAMYGFQQITVYGMLIEQAAHKKEALSVLKIADEMGTYLNTVTYS